MIYAVSHKEKDDRHKTLRHRKGQRRLNTPSRADVQRKMDEQSFSHQLKMQWEDVKKKLMFVPPKVSCLVTSGEYPHDETKEEVFELTLLQRIFLLFDQPEQCFIGEIISFVTMIVIIISCVGYIVSTGAKSRPSTCDEPACSNDPSLCPNEIICAPEEEPVFEIIETACIVFFSVDYFLRLALVGFVPARLAGVIPNHFDRLNSEGLLPAPEYSVPTTIWRYMTIPMNIIDLVAILPFYIAYFTTSGGSVSIIRILRLVRVLRVFKIGGMGNGITLMGNAMMNSLSAMGILLFFTVLGVILFGSIIFFLEAGTFEVTEEYPDGAYLRWNVLRSDREESPFSSILVSCYWAMVTFTTVGYGDLVPTSPFGRFVSLVLMYTGILVLALPISVIGANFQQEYERLQVRDGYDVDDEESIEGEEGSVVSTPGGTKPPTPVRNFVKQQSSSSTKKGNLDAQVDRLVKKTLIRERSNSAGIEEINDSLDPLQDQLRRLTLVCSKMMDRIEELHLKQDAILSGKPLSEIKSERRGDDDELDFEQSKPNGIISHNVMTAAEIELCKVDSEVTHDLSNSDYY